MTSWVLDPYTPDGVRGQAFEDFDPAAIDAVKAVLTCGNTRDRVPPTTESGGRAAQTAGPQADDLLGGVDVAHVSQRSPAIADPGVTP